jgi:hypothetical protein
VASDRNRIQRRRQGTAFHESKGMNWNHIADNWRQIKGRLKSGWDNLTGNEPIGGTRDQLARLPERKDRDSQAQAEEARGEFPHGLIPIPISNSDRRSL